MAMDQALVDEACSVLGVHSPVELKQGGQKVVYKVDSEGGPRVLKVIEVLTVTDAVLTRAEREVDLLLGIHDDHVVKVRSSLTELGNPRRGVAWLEEFLDGDDLAALQVGGWSWADAWKLGHDVAHGLAALHTRRVVHRDLSPHNVRRCTPGRWVVIDPGYARHELRTGLTVGGQPGTYAFMSPEHLMVHSGSPTAASDVFGVGNLLYFSLTGAPPVPYRQDAADYRRRLAKADHVPIKDLREDLDDAAVGVIERCLHRQPARRYLNGAALVSALEEVAP